MRFHVTITDNETGEVLHDADACAILAGINGGRTTASIHMTACGPLPLAETLSAAEDVVQEVRSRHPEIGALSGVFRLMDKNPKTEETENRRNRKQ